MCRVTVTEAYLADESVHGVMGQLDLPPKARATYGDRLVPRPFFLDRATADRVSADLTAFFDLLVSLPARFFGGSLASYAAALGIPPAEVALMSAERPPCHGRADIYRVGEQFRLLEFNCGSQLGIRDLGEVARAILEVPDFKPFADEHNLTYVHPLAELLDEIGRDRTVAFLEAGGGLARFAKGFASHKESCARLGVDILMGELEDVVERNGYAYLDGTRIDVVVRFFAPRQAVGRVGELAKAHRTEVFTPLSSYLYGNKNTLALLSEHRAELDDGERELIDRLLPWTRALQQTDLDQVRANRENLILKAAGEFAGTGIHPGWLHDDAEWRQLLDDAQGRPFVVQERVRPTPDVVPGDDRPWLTTWGWYVGERGFAGLSIRSMPFEAGAVVSFHGNSGTRVSTVLLH